MSDLNLIRLLGPRWRELRDKYPDEQDPRGWKHVALKLAIYALAEEHYGEEELKLMLEQGRLDRKRKKVESQRT